MGTDPLPDQVVYKVGDKVLLNTRNYPQFRQHKLSSKFIGPFAVSKVLGPTVLQLQLPNTYQIHNSVNIDSVKKYVETTDEGKKAPPPVTMDKKGNTLYDVERILDERVRRGRRQFKVRWVGYGPEDDSWEPHSALRHLTDMIKQFRSTVPKKPEPAAKGGAAAASGGRRTTRRRQQHNDGATTTRRRSGRSRR